MPRRLGHLWERVCDLENCRIASYNVEKSHDGDVSNPLIMELIERRARNAQRQLQDMTWNPGKFKRATILDGRRKKERSLRIPSLFDQTVHHAIMNILNKEILKRNYYYNCGSIPDAGQSRACDRIKQIMKSKRPKYAFQWDFKKFYSNIRHDKVMYVFKRFIKDPKMLWGISMILEGMLDEEERLQIPRKEIAIGFNPSHWIANTVINYILNILIREFKGIDIVHYMDDGLALGNNKRILHRVKDRLILVLKDLGLILKHTYQVYKIAKRGVRYLSYVFFHECTLVRKYLLYKISRVSRRGPMIPTEKFSMSLLSYLGILKHCCSYTLRKLYVYIKYSVPFLKGVVSNAAKSRSRVLRLKAA